jgi:hypothetical protein
MIILWSSCISHTFTMSHWPSVLTVCFPVQGAAVCAPGCSPHFGTWIFMLVQSRYSGDPDMIPDHAMIGSFACGIHGDLNHFSCPSSTLCRPQIMAPYRQDPVRPIPVTGEGEPCGTPVFLTLSPCLTGPVELSFAS